MRGLLRPKVKRAAVLGCGPAGLFAAEALDQAGFTVTIFSQKRRSEMFGAQFLHRPIPGLSEWDPVPISMQLQGSWEDSTRKVYGPDATPGVTWDQYCQERSHAWDIRAAYHKAWGQWVGSIVPSEPLRYPSIADISEDRDYSLVVSSIPAWMLCNNSAHQFAKQRLWAVGDAPERGIFCPIPSAPFTVTINGLPDTRLARVANLFGYTTAEWVFSENAGEPPIENIKLVENPLSTTCDCLPKVLRVGRYGAWDRRYLSHDGYYTVQRHLGIGG
jgi:hypothetical protein